MSLLNRDVQQIYIAYFGRPADSEGIAHWTTYENLGQVAESLANSQEYGSLFAQGDLTNLVIQIYQNLFHRAPDADGLKYWVSNLLSGTVTPSLATLTILQSALGSDANTMQAKIDAAEKFTTIDPAS